MMKKSVGIFLTALMMAGFLLLPQASWAQTSDSAVEYVRARVSEVREQTTQTVEGEDQPVQRLQMELLGGAQAGEQVEVLYGEGMALDERQLLNPGKVVILAIETTQEETRYVIVDHFRLPAVAIIFVIFLAITTTFTRWRGLTSVLGLLFSLFVLIWIVIPRLIAGDDPVVVTLFGCLLIAGVSLYLAHGFNRRTSLALLSTVLTLALAVIASIVFVRMTSLFGVGTEEAGFLQLHEFGDLDLRGLLLAGILIGTLGVLDDITTAQTAVVEELKRANSKLNFRELYRRALSVGEEHILSLVNTLALAYIGAALPMFLIFSLNVGQPLWVVANSEFIVEEIVRTIVGSVTLILAVPISTVIAAYFFDKGRFVPRSGSHGHSHSHGHHHH